MLISTEINCDILGYAKCKWVEDSGVGNSHYIENNYAKDSFINQNFSLIEEVAGQTTELPAGDHNFEIAYALSPHLSTSFKCKNGSIKYKVLVTVDRPWKRKAKFEFPFTVIRPLNLNSEGDFIKNPMKEELSKNFKLDFTSEPLYISASIPYGGYVPGQSIIVKIEANNQSKTNVKEIIISLKKIVHLTCRKPKRKSKELIITVAKISSEAVPVLTMKHLEKRLVIPSLPPNITNCDVIQVQYELRVKAKTGGLSRSPKLKIPITIGTAPLDIIRPTLSRVNLRKF